MEQTESIKTTMFQIFILGSICVLLIAIFAIRALSTQGTEANADGIPHTVTIPSDVEYSQAETDLPMR
jgi:hypothetical protein